MQRQDPPTATGTLYGRGLPVMSTAIRLVSLRNVRLNLSAARAAEVKALGGIYQPNARICLPWLDSVLPEGGEGDDV